VYIKNGVVSDSLRLNPLKRKDIWFKMIWKTIILIMVISVCFSWALDL